jgi:phosphoribosylglycinamide formyltransferase-1
LRLGIIGSSGGSALASAVECLRQAGKSTDFVVVVDRECGMLQWAREEKLPSCSIPYSDPISFSSNALNFFRQYTAEQILFFYTRRVCKPLVGGLPVFKIHPALLPAFRGLHGVDDALRYGVRILGASLHGVDDGLDTGPIIAQVATALPVSVTPILANKISFLQKVYLTLIWYELIHKFGMVVDINSRSVNYDREPSYGVTVSPSLEDAALAEAFNRLQKKENCRVVIG